MKKVVTKFAQMQLCFYNVHNELAMVHTAKYFDIKLIDTSYLSGPKYAQCKHCKTISQRIKLLTTYTLTTNVFLNLLYQTREERASVSSFEIEILK